MMCTVLCGAQSAQPGPGQAEDAIAGLQSFFSGAEIRLPSSAGNLAIEAELVLIVLAMVVSLMTDSSIPIHLNRN